MDEYYIPKEIMEQLYQLLDNKGELIQRRLDEVEWFAQWFNLN